MDMVTVLQKHPRHTLTTLPIVDLPKYLDKLADLQIAAIAEYTDNRQRAGSVWYDELDKMYKWYCDGK